MDLAHILDDQELLEELQDRRRDLADSSGLEAAGADSLERAVRTVREGRGEGLPEGLEAIIYRFGRPALLVQHGTYTWQQDDTRSSVWEARLAVAGERLQTAISAVGRLDVRNHPRTLSWVGTGWLVAEDVVVTNRHVATEFARRQGEKLVFRHFMDRMVRPTVDLRHEHKVRDSVEFQVKNVLWIAGEDEPDVAFLRVSRAGQRFQGGEQSDAVLPSPVPLSSRAVPAGQRVAVIGYPGYDSRHAQDRHRIFGDVFNVKRLQPGEILSASDSGLTHDCSTLGGNSGSVLLDLESGEAVGLHFSGSYWTANYAVPAAVVQRLLEDKLGAGGPDSNVRRSGLQRQESKPGLQRAVTQAPMLSGPEFRTEWARAERRVCCVEIDLGGHVSGGTGFLIGPDLVLTNAHVMQDLLPPEQDEEGLDARGVICRFDFRTKSGKGRVKLANPWLVAWSPHSEFDLGDRGGLPEEDELDYAVLRLAEKIGDEAERGWIKFEDADPPKPGSWLTIIQHPFLGSQAGALHEEAVLDLNANHTRIRHQVNTEKGSSGSPCFDANWNLIALHHAGDPNFDPDHKPEFNQAIPIGLIRRDLESRGHYPFTDKISAQPVVPFHFDKFAPRLIILCSSAQGQAKAQTLIEESNVPPKFVAHVGNQPPSDVSANAIALFLGDPKSVQDDLLLETVRTLRGQHLQIIPVVEDLDKFHQHTPEELHEFNAEEWRRGAGPSGALCRRIRQLLGLEVDPAHRSVFISYSRQDSRDEVAMLGKLLGRRGYDVFIDVEDLPIGAPVQATIERQISGQNSLLYFETPNASRSPWIYAELKWAYTRGLALVVFQRGRLRSRHHLIQSLPVTYSADNTPIDQEVDRLIAELDFEIAQASTRCVQLGRTVEAIIESHSQGRAATVESIGENLILATFEMALLGQVNRRRLLFWCVPHRPATPLIRHLATLHDEKSVDGAALIYEAPEYPLTDDEQEDFRKLRESRLVFWIERQNLSRDLSELITTLASRGKS